MKILIAPDSFKDALSAPEVCIAIQRGILLARPEVETVLFPMADGGDGTAEILAWHLPGEMVTCTVADPLLRPVEARYFLSGEMAFIEMAQASGLQLLRPEERNPLKTSTFGTGQLIRHAIGRGAKKILLGIGGSATNDAGMGMAAALGWHFLSKNGEELAPTGENLGKVETLQKSEIRIPKSEIVCDVDNPLTGAQGAAQVYARQKGADDAAVALLEAGMLHFSKKLSAHFGQDFAEIPGAGAAGGLGAGAMAFLGATLRSGVETVMQLTGFEEVLKKTDLVITGEGRLDGQTLHGKTVRGICQKAARYGVPVVALCGAVEALPEEVAGIGLRAAFSLLSKPQTLPEALVSTKKGLENLAYNVLKIMDLYRGKYSG
ncbi:MAG: glycerate kinase [Bacteroidetes bacterium]|nr:glycerate kinase [Bacteroidota bacterium]